MVEISDILVINQTWNVLHHFFALMHKGILDLHLVYLVYEEE